MNEPSLGDLQMSWNLQNARRFVARSSLIFVLVLLALGCAVADEPAERSEQDDERTAANSTDELEMSKREAADSTNRGKADWSADICEANDWYGDGDCDWFCPEEDPDCELEPLGPEPNGRSTRAPIVLHHGFMGSDTNIWSYNGVADALREDGHRVFQSEVAPFHSVDTRASQLGEQIDAVLAEYGAEDVNLVAHSMGGLDARYLVSELGYDDRVASVTTISSPHRGTRIADAYLGLAPEATDGAVDALAELVGDAFSDVGEHADIRAAMRDLSTEGVEQFNEQHPNVDGVYYQSWAGVSSVLGIEIDGIDEVCEDKLLMHDGELDRMDGLLWAVAAIVAGGTELAINDGMARVSSAKWGNFRGCIPADHLDQVGQIGDDGVNDNTGFDHVRFYRNLAFDLAERGH